MKHAPILVGILRNLRSRVSIAGVLTAKNSRMLTTLACALLGLTGCGSNWWVDKHAGRPRNDLEREAGRQRGTIRLPDLRPRSAHGRVSGEDVWIRAKVRNQGPGGADTFQVVAEVGAPFPVTFTSTVRRLGIGADWEEEMGVIQVPLAQRPATISVRVIVDPVAPRAPRGQQLEENEGNNVGNYTVMVY